MWLERGADRHHWRGAQIAGAFRRKHSFSEYGGMAPVRALLSGGDIVIVGAILNKNLQKFVARKEVRKPAWEESHLLKCSLPENQ